jgi:hypothetical protein
MMTAILIAAAGAVFSTPLLAQQDVSLRYWANHYKVFVGSVLMTLVAAPTYTALHFALEP